MNIFTRLFWQDAIERAVSTMAQTLLVFGGVDGVGFLNISTTKLITATLLMGAATLLKSIVAAKKADSDTASFTVDTKPLQ